MLAPPVMMNRIVALWACCAAWFSLSNALAGVLINEIHYDPPEKTELAEFIELHNAGAAVADLSGWELTGGVNFTLPPNTSLAAGGYLVIAENPAAFNRKFGKSALGPWTGLLANDGERISLRDGRGEIIDEVTYKLGFPWPTVGDAPGYSIELVHPDLDNDLGGSWRPSVKGAASSGSRSLVGAGETWRYFKGAQAPSSPISQWRTVSFDDSEWLQGATPIVYGDDLPMRTRLDDMRGSYTSVFLRKKINVGNPAEFQSLVAEVAYDDGFKLWINGTLAAYANMPTTEVSHTGVSSNGARDSAEYQRFVLPSPASLLRAGENIVAVQLQNVSLANSSDCFIDLRILAEAGSANAGPTPGARNAVHDTTLPPHVRQVEHLPEQPRGGEAVRITAKITDPDGVASVHLEYQIVNPGSYIELQDPAYRTNWTRLEMNDAGAGGDDLASDHIYSVTIPASIQVHRRLIRYRIIAADRGGLSIQAPYLDDPQPNFAYFVYDGVPGWSGAARPGSTAVENFSSAEMGRLPTYHLIAKRTAVETATWTSKYRGDAYPWMGTLVHDGMVYDHISYRARGGVWRYAMGKNMWKIDFNRGHDFQARDEFGRGYGTKWRKLNLGANIQQGNFEYRGEQGMFESVGFRLFNLAGVESPKTHWSTLRIIDEAEEANPTNQFKGDFWGLYLAVEQMDGRFLDEHNLPDGNLYKMENYRGEKNNQGRLAAADNSDLVAFLSTFRNGTPTMQWWRSNFDVDKYYSYQAMAQAIHHYDICFGKNYFYFLNPESGKWSVQTWDLDLTWADNMYESSCDATDEFKQRVAHRAEFNVDYKNRVRELRDLLVNPDQAWKLIDEYVSYVKGTNSGPNILAADRAMWDYNPVMVNSAIVDLNKAGHGLFYRFRLQPASLRGSFEVVPRIMKNYVTNRAARMDTLARDTLIPDKPTISYTGSAGFPVNRLSFKTSPFNRSGGTFAAMKWRVGEIRTASPGVRGIYEIEPVWESNEITSFAESIQVPSGALRVGHTYRARVRMKDINGGWSHWSDPVEFVLGEADNAAAVVEHLRITEVMYNPAGGSDFEYIEFQNTGSAELRLDGVRFTAGIEFAFPAGAVIAPGEYLLISRADPAALRTHYQIPATVRIFGPYSGALNNDGETVTLKTATAGAEIASFTFKDRSEWPIAADGAGHSIFFSGSGTMEYGGNWKSSARVGGSPGRNEVSLPLGLVINEINAHTDYSDAARPEYDSNDWIELYNSGGEADLRDYYLSDDFENLKKWRLPAMTLAAGARISFDEVNHFHNPVTTGFGLDKAGEELYLSYLPGTVEDRVVDAVRFRAQENGRTWGRFPDGSSHFRTLVPTRDSGNEVSAPGIVVSEIMYRPGLSNLVEESWQEFIELYNPSAASVALMNTNGAYRLDGGIAYTFPAAATIPAGGAILVVSFDPALLSEASRFRTHFGIQSSNIILFGPFVGRLGNHSDRVALEKPEAPDAPGEPLSWVTIDETIYTRDSGAFATGESLNRIDFTQSGNVPSNQRAASPTPGWIAVASSGDADGDTLPDDWELAHGLNPADPSDAQLDADGDGLSNSSEFKAGTHPGDANSNLRLTVSESDGGFTLAFEAIGDRRYIIEYSDFLGSGTWSLLRDVIAVSGKAEISDLATHGTRFYRVRIPAQP